MKRKCPLCKKTFESNSIKKIYCDTCLEELDRERRRKYYNNNASYRNNKNIKDNKRYKEKFIHDNYYGLILGTTKFSPKRQKNFDKEKRIVNKQKNIVLGGKSYTNSKYIDLFDNTKTKTKKSGIKRKEFKSTEISQDINNLKNINKYINLIKKKLDLDVDEEDIIGVYKVELNMFNKYILFTKYKGRNIENSIYIPRRFDNYDENK